MPRKKFEGNLSLLTEHVEAGRSLGLSGPVGEYGLVFPLVVHGDAVDGEAVVAALLLDLEVRLAVLVLFRVGRLPVLGPRDHGLEGDWQDELPLL